MNKITKLYSVEIRSVSYILYNFFYCIVYTLMDVTMIFSMEQSLTASEKPILQMSALKKYMNIVTESSLQTGSGGQIVTLKGQDIIATKEEQKAMLEIFEEIKKYMEENKLLIDQYAEFVGKLLSGLSLCIDKSAYADIQHVFRHNFYETFRTYMEEYRERVREKLFESNAKQTMHSVDVGLAVAYNSTTGATSTGVACLKTKI
ncbi:MAG: hypothetical protein ACTSXG_02730 [Alphaproteobacteria bacterium]